MTGGAEHTHVEHDAVMELIRREAGRKEYDEIRTLWRRHSIAEDRRDLPGLISTLTSDCVYEFPQTGHRWEGHDGATRFYTELLRAFPDIRFELTDIVIGPQGVCEEARVTGTQMKDWLGEAPTMTKTQWRVVIFFPWDQPRHLFRGEKVYSDALPTRRSTTARDTPGAAPEHP
ncbi:MAG: nuclear transport factor 2 family protein [Acidimicrobiales bacterium]